MNIGIIGTGNVGGALGTRWAQGGHQIVFGSSDPRSAKVADLLAKAGPNATAATVKEAVAASDAILLAIPWEAAQPVVEENNAFAGKLVIDATNPLLPGLSGLSLGTTNSAGETIAKWAPRARVVKAFNTVGANIMANPDFGANKVAMFYCGDNKEAKESVHQLATELGFAPFDAGPLTQARLLEPFALLWISLAYAAGFGRDIAFEFLRR